MSYNFDFDFDDGEEGPTISYRYRNDSFDFDQDPTKRDDNSTLSSLDSSDYKNDTEGEELEKALDMSIDVHSWLVEHEQDTTFAEHQIDMDEEAVEQHKRFVKYPKVWANKRRKHDIKKKTVDLTVDLTDEEEKKMPGKAKKVPKEKEEKKMPGNKCKRHKK